MARNKTTGDGKGIVNTNVKGLKVSRGKAARPTYSPPPGMEWFYDSSADRWYMAPGSGYSDTTKEGVRRVW